MQTVNLNVENRESMNRGKLNELRRSGWFPGVIYGDDEHVQGDKNNVLLKINEKIFLKTVGDHKSSNMILALDWGKGKANVVIKEIQRDPISHQMIHVDFQRISMSKKIEVMVPIHLSGESQGVKLHGGILEHITREVRVSSLPKDIPNVINIDISNLNIGQGILVKDIPTVQGVEILTDVNHIVVHVVAQSVIEETPAAVPGATAAEPEVIAKGKKPEEGDAAATPATPQAGAKAPADKAGAKAAPAK